MRDPEPNHRDLELLEQLRLVGRQHVPLLAYGVLPEEVNDTVLEDRRQAKRAEMRLLVISLLMLERRRTGFKGIFMHFYIILLLSTISLLKLFHALG